MKNGEGFPTTGFIDLHRSNAIVGGAKLYIRQCYLTMYKEVQQGRGHMAVTGTPGIENLVL